MRVRGASPTPQTPRYGPLGRFALLVLLVVVVAVVVVVVVAAAATVAASSSISKQTRVESRFEQLAKVFLLGHYNKG